MLILPLHRPITRATFPLATALLVLANVLVFFGWQSGDAAAMQRAQQYYLDAGLGRYEVPAYQRHLRETGQRDALDSLRDVPPGRLADYVAANTLTDVAFVRSLHSGALFQKPDDFEAWKPLRADYEALQREVFTLRHVMRGSEVDPWRMFAATFLHAGFMHLFGNMVFLVAVGLLVEGALGSWRFLGVYLLGGFGASAASLLWRWGETGGGLGASGAIAALMGAFCVVWGRQPVRFFYWFGVVFDYVRAPAIWLLPLWLGWELFQLLTADDIGVGFAAHAGGLVTGAVTGAVLVWLGQVRTEFIRDLPAADDFEQRLAQAQQHLGRLQLAEADALLQVLVGEQPRRIDVQLARYRGARLAGNRVLQGQCGHELLAQSAQDAVQVQAQREAWLEMHATGLDGMPDPKQAAALLRQWLTLGEADAAAEVLEAVSPAALADDETAQAQLWFELALAYRDRLAPDAQLRTLRTLLARYPDQPQAVKARFWIENVFNGGNPVEGGLTGKAGSA